MAARRPVPLRDTDVVGPHLPVPAFERHGKRPPRVRKPSSGHDVIYAPTSDIDAHRAELRVAFGEILSDQFVEVRNASISDVGLNESAALMCFDPGANDRRSPVRPQTSPGRGAHPTGSACRREPEPKDRGCTIGVISNWPTSRPSHSTAQMMVCGRAVY
jgi:hypothetical protein